MTVIVITVIGPDFQPGRTRGALRIDVGEASPTCSYDNLTDTFSVNTISVAV